MSSVELNNRAKLILKTPQIITGTLKDSDMINREAKHLAIKNININMSEDIEDMDIELLLQYGNIVDNQFQQLDIENDTFKLNISKSNSEELANPISPSERSMDLKTIVYLRIMGYLRAIGYVE